MIKVKDLLRWAAVGAVALFAVAAVFVALAQHAHGG
jgi:hypothetical protein